MTLVNAFIFMISLMLFTLGTLNFEVQNVQEFISRLLGHGPESREYTATLDRVESIQTSARTLYQYETFVCQKNVDPWAELELSGFRWPWQRSDRGLQMLLTSRVHIGYDVSDGTQFECHQDSSYIYMDVHLPDPTVLAVEFDENSLRDIHAYAVGGNPSLAASDYNALIGTVLTHARLLAVESIDDDEYDAAQVFFEDQFRTFINELGGDRDVIVSFSYGEEIENDH
ncbi:MAG TPA: hypothetical protein PL067_09460 [Bacteroidales bacterium]|nr:hypothetical protein [Bacteroidales bacterium]